MAYIRNFRTSTTNVGIISGSSIQVTGTLFGSIISGTTSQFTTLTGSTVTGSIARFGIVSSSVISASQYIGLPSFSSIPAGTTGQIQFNSNNSFGADSNFVWDNTNKRLGIGINQLNSSLHVASSSNNIVMLSLENNNETNNNKFSISFRTKMLKEYGNVSIISGSLATQTNDYFGNSVAMNSTGDRVIVGAYNDGSNTSTGLAYIFVSGAGGWTQQQALSGSFATQASDRFSISVAINSTGDRVIVGASSDETGSTTSTGVAYIFVSGAGGWTQQQALSGSFAVDSNDFFGYSVAINSTGDRVIVGAYSDETGSTTSTGVAYIFVSGASGWTQQQALSGSFAVDSNDNFGISVKMNSAGNRVVVGALSDETGSTSGTGLVYVFNSGTNGWIQQAVFTGSNMSNGSSDAVAFNSAGDLIAAANISSSIAQVLIYTSGTTGWKQEQVLTGTLVDSTNDNFGYAIAMNSVGDRIIVGAYSDESGSTSGTGLVYLYVSGTTGWVQRDILSGSLATQTNDYFGNSVAMNSVGDRIIVGAFYDETGSNTDTGIAYIHTNTILESQECSYIDTTYLNHTHSLRSSDMSFYITNTGSLIQAIKIENTGKLNISGTMRLGALVAGTNTGIGRASNGDITAVTSDSRLKNQINTITSSLGLINNLRGVKFKWDNKNDPDFMIGDTEKDKYQIGLIAQEVETVLPELVYLNGVKDYKSVRYPEMVAVLIEGIKELTSEINILKSEIQILKSGSI